MKPFATSTILHTAILTWGLWHFGTPEKLDMGGETLPVTLVTDVSQATLGEQGAPEAEKSAPTPTKTPEKLPMPAENVGDNEVDLKTPPAPKPSPHENVSTAEAPPPPPPPAVTPQTRPEPPQPTPPEPTPPPEPPAEVAEQKPEPTPAEVAPEIDPLAAEIAKAEAETPAPPRNVPLPQVKPKPPEPKPAEPVKVAEAKKAEPVKEPAKEPAKETSKSKEKPKDTKKPATQTSTEKQFDADQIAALLNKQDSSGGGAKRSTQQAALGATRQTGGSLSQSEMDALRGQIMRCWNPPAGSVDAGNFRVKISMQLGPTGELEGLPEILSGGGSSMAERVASEAAVRAVRRCAPYNLPAEKYDTWAQVTVNFDPSQMF
ncbi:cell envelope integrity protein TolA [Aureimonas phyllosphaerae]|uniref:cell envelope integrity protein TolA n=1 Tax=Aureimonas phyllosphaerae TaxID=1166078 RepID=UPI003A5C70F3